MNRHGAYELGLNWGFFPSPSGALTIGELCPSKSET